MDWVHCNDCYKQPYTSPNTTFVLTSCARLQCTNCNSTNSCINRDCKPCRSQNYSAVPLDDSIPPAVEDYFCDPLDHLKKYLKVNDFQRGHRDRLSKHLGSQLKKWEEKMAAKESQFQKINSDLQNQLQKLRIESQQTKDEIQLLKTKNQQLENCLAKERSMSRPVANNLYQNSRNTPIDPPKRNIPTPSTNERARDDRNNMVSWQQKVPGPTNPPDRAAGPIRQRFAPVQHQQQPPYKSRVGQQFVTPETPGYFHNSTSAAPVAVVRASNNLAAKQLQPTSTYPTPPVYRSRQSANKVITPGIQQAPNQPQMNHKQQQPQQNSYYNRVYNFLSEAAREALTPEISQTK